MAEAKTFPGFDQKSMYVTLAKAQIELEFDKESCKETDKLSEELSKELGREVSIVELADRVQNNMPKLEAALAKTNVDQIVSTMDIQRLIERRLLRLKTFLAEEGVVFYTVHFIWGRPLYDAFEQLQEEYDNHPERFESKQFQVKDDSTLDIPIMAMGCNFNCIFNKLPKKLWIHHSLGDKIELVADLLEKYSPWKVKWDGTHEKTICLEIDAL